MGQGPATEVTYLMIHVFWNLVFGAFQMDASTFLAVHCTSPHITQPSHSYTFLLLQQSTQCYLWSVNVVTTSEFVINS